MGGVAATDVRSVGAPTPPTTGPGGRRKRRPERHSDLLLAAVDLFHRQDYHSTTLEQIADAVGVSPAAVYRHFRSKQAILDAAATWATGRLFEQLGDGRRADGTLPTVTVLVEELAAAIVHVGDAVAILDRHLHSLSPATRLECLAATAPYVETWSLVLADLRPDLDADQRIVLVHVVLHLFLSAVGSGVPVGRAVPVARDLALAALGS